MQDGAIVGQGTHERLLAADDVYRALHKAQFAPPVLDGQTT
jgi:ABC-type multidrug transport system fused ATPase/permease subunit